MKRLFASLLLASCMAFAMPAIADADAPAKRKYHYTPQYRSAPQYRNEPARHQPARRAPPAHLRSHHRSAGPVRKVWRKREWWQYHDQDEIVVEEDDGIVIEEDDGIVVDEDE